MKEIRPLKRLMIKEELVELTGDMKSAILLNQFLWLSEYLLKQDEQNKIQAQIIAKQGYEKKANDILSGLNEGWFFKQFREIEDDTFGVIKRSTAEEKVKKMVDSGLLLIKKGKGMDSKNYYKVDLFAVQERLQKLGYPLEGYSLPISENRTELSENRTELSENRTVSSRTSKRTSNLKDSGESSPIHKDPKNEEQRSKDGVASLRAKEKTVFKELVEELQKKGILLDQSPSSFQEKCSSLTDFKDALQNRSLFLQEEWTFLSVVFEQTKPWGNTRRNYKKMVEMMVTLYNAHKAFFTEAQFTHLEDIFATKGATQANINRTVLKLKTEGIVFDFDTFLPHLEVELQESLILKQGSKQKNWKDKRFPTTTKKQVSTVDRFDGLDLDLLD